jgi:hypothetical protein
VVDGVTVNIKAYRKGGTLAQAALINTELPGAADPDLGTPNVYYGGTGINSDDPVNGYNLFNNQGVGKAVIIQTPGALVPDDYLLGDSLVFTFSEPVFMESFVGVDFEDTQIATGAGVTTYDVNGVSQGFIGFNPLFGEDNSLEEVSLRRTGVKRLKVYYGSVIPGSGGVARLCFVKIPKPEVVDACSGAQLSYTSALTGLRHAPTGRDYSQGILRAQ